MVALVGIGVMCMRMFYSCDAEHISVLSVYVSSCHSQYWWHSPAHVLVL